MHKIKILIIGAALCALTGCATLTRPARVHTIAAPPSPSWMDYDASRRGAYILPKNGGLAVCAEPSPDVALNTVTNLVAQVELQNPNVSVQAQLAFQQSVVELTQRTESLNFLRESMYRMCEQALDGNLSSDQVKELYDTALKTSLALAEADLAKQQNQLAARLQDPEVRKMWTELIENGSSSGITPQPPPAKPSQPPTNSPSAKH